MGRRVGSFHFASCLHLIVGSCWHPRGSLGHVGAAGRGASLLEGNLGSTWRDRAVGAVISGEELRTGWSRL